VCGRWQTADPLASLQAFANNRARLAGNNNIFGGFLYDQK
jgi:hypothetical protein